MIFDLGLVKHVVFDQLTEIKVGFITRLRKGSSFEVEVVLQAEDLEQAPQAVIEVKGQRSLGDDVEGADRPHPESRHDIVVDVPFDEIRMSPGRAEGGPPPAAGGDRPRGRDPGIDDPGRQRALQPPGRLHTDRGRDTATERLNSA